jgi:hypothetical protein
MLAEHRIFETQVIHEGQVHKASYFVENGIIHASIDGQTTRAPVGRGPAEAIVKAVLLGKLRHKSRQMAKPSALV